MTEERFNKETVYKYIPNNLTLKERGKEAMERGVAGGRNNNAEDNGNMMSQMID